MALKKGLGKGLGALIPEATATDDADSTVQQIKITDIEPNRNQPRTKFAEEALEELSASIREHGIVQPLILVKQKTGYQIVAGERRWRAARLAGLKYVPAIIKTYTPREVIEVALVENLQREDLDAIEEAVSFQMLIDAYDMTQEDVSKKVSRSRSSIANTLRLNGLPENIQNLIKDNKISAGHGRALIGLKEDIQAEALEIISTKNLNVRQTESLVKKLSQKPKNELTSTVIKKFNLFEDIEEKIIHALGGKAKLRPGTIGGKIEIEYYNQEHLDKILEILKKGTQ